jgi:hypothetical protein
VFLIRIGSGIHWLMYPVSRKTKIVSPKKGENEENPFLKSSLLGWRLFLEPECPVYGIRQFFDPIFFSLS